MTPGNHDGSAYPGFEMERRVYAEQWGTRKSALRFLDDTHYPYYYAFSAGDTLFVSLDATTLGHLPGGQIDWLRGVLARYGPRHERRIAFSHMPLWPFAQQREREFIGDPELERLLRDADLDLYLSGHHHAYFPGWRDGIAMLGVGNLGGNQRRLTGTHRVTGFSFAWMDIKQGDSFSIEAYHGPEFTDVVPKASLPEHVGQGAKALRRLDLARRAAQ